MAVTKIKHTVLLCDDDEFIARMYAFKLESEGYTVVIVESGTKVIEEMRRVRPDLVILDLMMPEKSGFEILQDLNFDTDESLKKTPIIVASNLAQQTDIDLVKAFDVVDFVVKSRTTPKELLEIVERHLKVAA